MFVGSSVIKLIPLAALGGVMIGTFAWNSLTLLRKVLLADAFLILLATVVTGDINSAMVGKYEAVGKRLRLRHLSRDCHALLRKAGCLTVDSDR